MARTVLTAKTALGSYPSLPISADAADLAWTASDNASGNQVACTGNDLVLVHNTSGASARTVTVTSVADGQKRTGDITTYSVGIGEYAVLGPFKAEGWMQTGGVLYLDTSSADIYFAVIALPQG